jgi:L-fucose isomerase-like protein
MLIRFTRLTNDRHRFEIVRDDRTSEAHEMETRSTLAHDLAHYAVEVEGGLSHSFYGRLAGGMKYAELTAMAPEGPEAMETERVVVLLQDAFKATDRGPPDPQRTLLRLTAVFDAAGDGRPAWLTGDLLARIIERLRRVHGQWRATRFHATLELRFP